MNDGRPRSIHWVSVLVLGLTWVFASLIFTGGEGPIPTQFGAGVAERGRGRDAIFLVPAIFSFLVLSMALMGWSMKTRRMGRSLSEGDRAASVRRLAVLQLIVALVGAMIVGEQGRGDVGDSSRLPLVLFFVVVTVLIWLVRVVVRERASELDSSEREPR